MSEIVENKCDLELKLDQELKLVDIIKVSDYILPTLFKSMNRDIALWRYFSSVIEYWKLFRACNSDSIKLNF